MSKKVRLCLAVVTVVGLAAVTLGAVALTGADNFTSNGALVSGWYWLRAPEHSATYEFNVRAISGASEAWLNASFLATNGVNGGSGYDATVSLILSNDVGKKATGSMTVHNPFRPQDPTNTHGVGYQAYGAYRIPNSLWQGANKLKVVVKNPSVSTRHVAVKKDALVIASK